jgi:hypothetical protein
MSFSSIIVLNIRITVVLTSSLLTNPSVRSWHYSYIIDCLFTDHCVKLWHCTCLSVFVLNRCNCGIFINALHTDSLFNGCIGVISIDTPLTDFLAQWLYFCYVHRGLAYRFLFYIVALSLLF